MNQEDLLFLSAVELAAGIRKKKISPVEIMRALLDRVERMNPTLNAYCSVHGHEALDIANKATTEHAFNWRCDVIIVGRRRSSAKGHLGNPGFGPQRRSTST